MRKKIKPDLNLEEIQQSLIDQVVELYASGMSMRNIGTQLSLVVVHGRYENNAQLIS